MLNLLSDRPSLHPGPSCTMHRARVAACAVNQGANQSPHFVVCPFALTDLAKLNRTVFKPDYNRVMNDVPSGLCVSASHVVPPVLFCVFRLRLAGIVEKLSTPVPPWGLPPLPLIRQYANSGNLSITFEHCLKSFFQPQTLKRYLTFCLSCD